MLPDLNMRPSARQAILALVENTNDREIRLAVKYLRAALCKRIADDIAYAANN